MVDEYFRQGVDLRLASPSTPSWCSTDRFSDHILPDKIHMLNVSFLVPQLRREFGGCAGNIAYNLKLLGDTGYPDGHGGPRFRAVPAVDVQRPACRRITSNHRDASTPRRPSSPPTWMTTRSRRFIPGAMQQSHLNQVADARESRSASWRPDGRDGMIQHRASSSPRRGIPFIFDPGQGLPMFGGDDLRALHRPGDLGGGQRLRMGAGAAEDRLERGRGCSRSVSRR